MDKELVEQVRKTLETIRNTLEEINRYFDELRKQTDAEIAEMARRTARLDPGTQNDPRHPYVAHRQPRRDGDSFGSVLPHDDDPTGTVRPPGKR